jgi:hypothetical protein
MQGALRSQLENLFTFILVAPLTDFSKELAMAAGSNTGGLVTACGQNGDWQSYPLLCRTEQPDRYSFHVFESLPDE